MASKHRPSIPRRQKVSLDNALVFPAIVRLPRGITPPIFASDEQAQIDDATARLQTLHAQAARGLIRAQEHLEKFIGCFRLCEEIGDKYPTLGKRWVGSHWYWNYPHIPANFFAQHLFHVPSSSMPYTLLHGQTVLDCRRCGEALYARSRADALSLFSGRDAVYGRICFRCRQEMERYERERPERLRRMSYSEYLQSPEWEEKRKWMLAMAGYRCQVCNARNKSLHVHHRTYERIKHEEMEDLIVLCVDCHHLFHQRHKL